MKHKNKNKNPPVTCHRAKKTEHPPKAWTAFPSEHCLAAARGLLGPGCPSTWRRLVDTAMLGTSVLCCSGRAPQSLLLHSSCEKSFNKSLREAGQVQWFQFDLTLVWFVYMLSICAPWLPVSPVNFTKCSPTTCFTNKLHHVLADHLLHQWTSPSVPRPPASPVNFTKCSPTTCFTNQLDQVLPDHLSD